MLSIGNISTFLLSSFLLLSSYSYIFSPSTIEGLNELGLPNYLRVELAILKLLAAFFIWLHFLPSPVIEWSYAGVFFFLTTALVAHVYKGDSYYILLALLIIYLNLALSYFYKFKNF